MSRQEDAQNPLEEPFPINDELQVQMENAGKAAFLYLTRENTSRINVIRTFHTGETTRIFSRPAYTTFELIGRLEELTLPHTSTELHQEQEALRAYARGLGKEADLAGVEYITETIRAFNIGLPGGILSPAGREMTAKLLKKYSTDLRALSTIEHVLNQIAVQEQSQSRQG